MSYINRNAHIVFSTKERERRIHGESAECLPKFIGGIVWNLEGHLMACDGPDDHAHLAVTMSPKITVSDFIGKIKSNSSRWIHEEFPK